jgi:hypothetical protein
MNLLRFAWVALALVAGCGTAPPPVAAAALADDTTPEATDVADSAAADTPQDLAQALDVPQEPCGVVKDKVICDNWLQGRIRNEKTGLATEAEFKPYNLVEFLATANQKYAVVTLGAWW